MHARTLIVLHYVLWAPFYGLHGFVLALAPACRCHRVRTPTAPPCAKCRAQICDTWWSRTPRAVLQIRHYYPPPLPLPLLVRNSSCQNNSRCCFHNFWRGQSKLRPTGATLGSFFRTCRSQDGGARTRGRNLSVRCRGRTAVHNCGWHQACPVDGSGTSSWPQTSSHGLPCCVGARGRCRTRSSQWISRPL